MPNSSQFGNSMLSVCNCRCVVRLRHIAKGNRTLFTARQPEKQEPNRVLREVTMYQGRTPRVLNTALALIALAFAACKVASASGTGANPVFNYPNFSGSPGVHPTENVAISGNAVNMTDGNSHSGGGLWYNTVQNIQAFTTTFTFQIPGMNGNGMFFVIQNSNSTTNATGSSEGGGGFGLNAGGNSANGMGYGGGGGVSQPALGNSVGIKFDATPFN